jgi:gmma-aminobutyric acid receptor subunit gamma
MGPQILKKFYSYTIESILTGCITTWYGNSTNLDRKALERVERIAQYITWAKLPAIQNLYIRRCERKARKIIKESSYPSYRLFFLRYRCIKFDTNQLPNSFYPQS